MASSPSSPGSPTVKVKSVMPGDSPAPSSRVPLSLALLSAYFFLLPLLGGMWEDLRPAALRILLLAAAGMRFNEGRQPGGTPWKPNPGRPVLLFLGWAVLSTLTGVSLTNSLHALHFLGAGMLTYLLVADAVRSETGRKWLFGGVLAGAAVTGLWALIEYRRTVVVLHDASWRAFGTFMNPNLLATYLLTALFVGLSGVLVARRPWVLAVGMGTLLCAVGLTLTGSRGAVVYSLPVAFLVWAGLSHLARAEDPQMLRAQRVRLAMILGAGLLLAAFFMKPTAARVGGAATTGEADSTLFRKLTWRGTLDMIRDRPLTGWGPGTWEVIYPRYARAGYTRAAHNSYLQTAADLGVPGLILWLAVMAYGLGGRKRDMGEAGRTAALVAAMLHNGVDYGWLLFGPAMLTWGLLGASRKSEVGSRKSQAPESEGKGEGLGEEKRASSGWKSLPVRAGGAVAVGAALLTLLGLPPAFAEIRGMEAEAALASKNFMEARSAYAVAASLDPTSSEWPRAAGRVLLYQMRDPQAAIPYFEEAMRRDPLRASIRHGLAIAYVSAGQIQQATGAFQEALKLDPNATRILMDYANLEERLAEEAARSGDTTAAKEHRERALGFYRRVAAVQESPVGQVKALAEMEDPTYVFARHRLAEDALRRGDKDEASRQIEAGMGGADAYLKGLERWREVMKVEGRYKPEEEQAVKDARTQMAAWKKQIGPSG